MPSATFEFWSVDHHAPGWHVSFYRLPDGRVVQIDEARELGFHCEPPPAFKDWVQRNRPFVCDEDKELPFVFDRLLDAYFKGEAERKWYEGNGFKSYLPGEPS